MVIMMIGCRTHRVPTYPWYFLLLLLLGPVSDFYSKSLIYHIQATTFTQVKVVEVRGCEFRFWIQNEGRAPEIPQAV